MMHKLLQAALQAGQLRPLDVHLGLALARWCGVDDGAEGLADAGRADDIDDGAGPVTAAVVVAAAGALVSAADGEQHTCVDLGVAAPRWWRSFDPRQVAQLLADHGVAGPVDADRPLVLEDNRLYLRRVALREIEVARRLRALATAVVADGQPRPELLTKLFPSAASGGPAIDWQRVAAAMAPGRRLTIIAGGPGTGKTTTVTALLAVLLDATAEPLRIHLAAPTGKAAARLTEAVRKARQRVEALWDGAAGAAASLAAIPAEATTLHRLLGYRPNLNTFGRDQQNPLAADVVVVDECSMIDLRLAWQLLAALPRDARLVLVGDQDQLASVEAGSVFADICSGLGSPVAGAADSARFTPPRGAELERLTGFPLQSLGFPETPPLADAVCWLRQRYRFGADTGIAEVAEAVNSGSLTAVEQAIAAAPAVHWHTAAISPELEQRIVEHFRQLHVRAAAGESAEELLTAVAGLQVLCAVRRGPRGVELLNSRIEALVRSAIGIEDEWFVGHPVMVLGNDHAMGLFNGDVGVMVADGVAFRRPDGQVRVEPLARLPTFAPVFAMTVHKSQGSEFNGVVLILPEAPSDQERRLLTRELLYTGLTRAREWVEIVAGGDTLAATVEQRIRRSGRLGVRLWA